MKKHLLIVFIWILSLSPFTTSLKAQEPLSEITNIVPPDAELAKLGSFGDFQRNLSTGQLAVNVPIHVFDGISLKYPINISYDPTGIRVQERATCVGLNWNLVGIGVITKTVIGQPDERTSSGFNTAYVYSDQFANGSHTPTNYTSDKVYLTAQGHFDMEPDYFSFSFNGRGGKFYYDPATNQYHTMPYSKLVITRSTQGSGGVFQLIDEKGYKYIFDISSDTYNDYGTIGTGQDYSDTYTSQWYLSKIYAPDENLEFSFEYIEGPMINEQIGISQSLTYLQSTNGCGIGGAPTIMPESSGNTSYSNVSRKSLFLSRVTGPLESASFHYKDRDDLSLRLDSISFSKNGVENQSWKFLQNYYTGANKLRLDSICQYSSQKKISKYSFEYDAGSIPQIGSKSQDLWGFNNGITNSSLVPQIWYNKQYIGKADRSSKYEEAKAGILTKVQYPTGGSSEFVYELNDYGSSDNPYHLEDEPIKKNVSHSIQRRYAEEGFGASTFTFTLNQPEVITFYTFRDQCNNRSGVCSNDPCTVTIKVIKDGNTTLISGTARKESSTTLLLEAGAYTVEVSTNDYQEYGSVQFSLPEITGYNKKIAAGGLRIKKVINYDPVSGQSNVRRFEYTVKNEPSRSSGTILSKPNFTYSSAIGTRCSGSSIPSCESWMNRVVITSNSTNDLFFSDGTPVAYTRVVEFNGEGSEGGSIEYLFSYASDGIIRAFPFAAPSSKSWKRGLPLKTTYLTALGDTVSVEKNEYFSDLNRNFHKLTGYKAGLSRYCPYYAINSTVSVVQMDYTSERFYLKKNTMLTYGQHGEPPVESSTEYFYDNDQHTQLTKINKKLSDGSFNIQHFKCKRPTAPSGFE